MSIIKGKDLEKLCSFLHLDSEQLPEFPLSFLAPGSAKIRYTLLAKDRNVDHHVADNEISPQNVATYCDHVAVPLFECNEEDRPDLILQTLVASAYELNHYNHAATGNILDSGFIETARSHFRKTMNKTLSPKSIMRRRLSSIVVSKNITVKDNEDINVIKLETDSIYEQYKEYFEPYIENAENIQDVVLLVGNNIDASVVCLQNENFGFAVLDDYVLLGILRKSDKETL